MIKHRSGMALCLKYVTNKVSSVAPLVVRRSHISSNSVFQPFNNSPTSSFLSECVGADDCSSTILLQNPQDTGSTGFSVIIRRKKYQSSRHIGPCPCRNADTVIQLRSVPDYFWAMCEHKAYNYFKVTEKSGGTLYYYSGIQLFNSGQVHGQDNVNNENSNDQNDPFQPPSAEQLETISKQLAKDLPRFFGNPKLDLQIYHPNIVLEDNIRGKHFSGLDQYYLQSRYLYLIGHMRFTYIKLDVMKITSHPEDGTIKVRWKISVFRLRKLWRLRLFQISSSFQGAKDTWIDGFSTYFVMGDGLVHKHIIDKMIPDPDQLVKKLETPKPVTAPNPLAYSNRKRV